MAEVTKGIRAVLSSPRVYEAFERGIGSTNVRRVFIERFARPAAGASVLDIGCGPGDILRHLRDVKYVGFDLSESYITSARKRYGDRGTFLVAGVDDIGPEELGRFDLAIAKGVFHHIDDDQVRKVCETARSVLGPGCRFVTIDPCFAPGQSRIARFVIGRDRGQNVRTEQRYGDLVAETFPSVETHVLHNLLRVPYTHCVVVATA